MKGELTEVGFTVQVDPTSPAYLRVTCWAKIEGDGFGRTLVYDHLSTTEAVDVVLAILDENRVGTMYFGDGAQPTIW